MVRLHTLSSWLLKHKGFAWRYARESCYDFRVTSEVTSSIGYGSIVDHQVPGLELVSRRAQQFSTGKGHFFEENVSLYWNFAKGTTAKAQGTWKLL